MALKLYNPEYRRRHQKRQETVRALLFLAAFFLVCALCFRLGMERMRGNESALQQEVVMLRAAKEKLEQDAVDLNARALTAETKFQELERQFTHEFGNDELKKLLIILRERLANGIKAERLAAVISTAENVRNCSAPEIKRFIVRTPLSRGPAASISFAGGAISIIGEGQSEINAQGNKESWYDSGKPVTVIFKQPSGEETRAEGPLPLHQSIIIGNTEYRFTISKGARSFVEVSADQCAYP